MLKYVKRFKYFISVFVSRGFIIVAEEVKPVKFMKRNYFTGERNIIYVVSAIADKICIIRLTDTDSSYTGSIIVNGESVDISTDSIMVNGDSIDKFTASVMVSGDSVNEFTDSIVVNGGNIDKFTDSVIVDSDSADVSTDSVVATSGRGLATVDSIVAATAIHLALSDSINNNADNYVNSDVKIIAGTKCQAHAA